MVKYIIDYWSHYPEMQWYAFFLDGEPLLDHRLPMFCDYATQHTKGKLLIDTNATNYAARERLIHPNLRQVRISLSAATRETYHKVHGADLYNKAVRTAKWFQENKHPTQKLSFHYMITKYNEHEINDFLEQWNGTLVKLFPLHQMPGIQENSENALTENPEWINTTENMKAWKQTRPIYVYPDGTRERRVMRSYMSCQGMSFCVQWNGLIRHCSDAPPEYNYGHIYDQDMLEAWHKRNRARATNPACTACNAKRPDWLRILRRYGQTEAQT